MNENSSQNKILSEAEFLKNYSAEKYPRPSLTADIAIFKDGEGGKKQILLIKRKNHPFMGSFALPGGFNCFRIEAEFSQKSNEIKSNQ